MQSPGPNKRYLELAEKWLNGTITPEEEKEFAEWYNEGGDQIYIPNTFATGKEELRQRILAKIDEKRLAELAKVIPIRKKIVFKRIAAAAAIIIAISIGGWLLLNKNEKQQIATTNTSRYTGNDVLPGTDGAILTLENGQQIVLDNVANGKLANPENIDVIKTDGQVVYNIEPQENTTKIVYHTLVTPKGKQYQLVLADGTKAWLNAESSIRFPVAFNSKDRRVEITGEVYFKVTHNEKLPFIAQRNDVSVEVLGTEFNFNTYDNELLIRTTLVNGSIKITNKNNSGLLEPGQQAQLNNSGDIKIAAADVQEAIAWKEGKFQFNNADLNAILRQAARWYDVDIDLQGTINEQFTGGISRNVNASQLFKILESTDKVKIEINDKRVIVRPK